MAVSGSTVRLHHPGLDPCSANFSPPKMLPTSHDDSETLELRHLDCLKASANSIAFYAGSQSSIRRKYENQPNFQRQLSKQTFQQVRQLALQLVIIRYSGNLLL